jgi:hypothetical protein
MGATSKTGLEAYFETGDKPSQAQFQDFINSYQNIVDENLLIGSELDIVGVVAATQATAYPLTKYTNNVITTDDTDCGVLAPTALPNRAFVITVSSYYNVYIFPSLGDSFTTLAVNDPMLLLKNKTYVFFFNKTGFWQWSILLNYTPPRTEDVVWSAWSSQEATGVIATITAPYKPTVVNIDYIIFRTLGSEAQVRVKYYADSGAGGSTGSGNYIWELPAGCSFDATNYPIYTGATPDIATRYSLFGLLSGSIGSQDAYTSLVYVVPYSALTFRLVAVAPDLSMSFVGSSAYSFNQNDYYIGLDFTFTNNG